MENPANAIALPELTGVVVEAFAKPEGFLHEKILPIVKVKKSQFKYSKFRTDQLKEIDRTERPIGHGANEATKIGRDWVPGETHPQALKFDIPDEILSDSPEPEILKAMEVENLVRKLKIGIERHVKELLDAATQTNAAAAKWDVVTNTTIETDVNLGKKTMRDKRGVNPNYIILGQTVAEAVLGNNRIRELVKYNPNDLLSRYVLPPTLFGMIPLSAGLLVDNANPGAAADIGPLWDDETVYLVYVDPNATVNTLTAIVAFRNTEEGEPFVVETWRDPDKSAKKAWYSTEVAQEEITVAPEAIYKITDTLT
jgi:hypothetical protein